MHKCNHCDYYNTLKKYDKSIIRSKLISSLFAESKRRIT
jgi:hypothetical protein